MNIITDFLSLRKQQVVLNGKPLFGLALKQVCPRVPCLDHYYFLFTLMTYLTIYQQLQSSLQMMCPSANNLNSVLRKISNWAFQWKISFNPDPSKQAQEVIFCRKIQKTCHPSIYFNNKSVKQVPSQKHPRTILDTKVKFQEHLKNVLNKVNKTIALLRKL